MTTGRINQVTGLGPDHDGFATAEPCVNRAYQGVAEMQPQQRNRDGALEADAFSQI